MKVGDLVELSAYGKNRKDLTRMLGTLGGVGLVTKRASGGYGYGGWQVLWYGRFTRPIRMDRKCLKHAKVNK